MKIDKIAFISAELPYWNLVTHAVFSEYGMPLVATIVRDAAYDVRAFAEYIGPIKWDQVMEADVVCFHAFSCTMPNTIDVDNHFTVNREHTRQLLNRIIEEKIDRYGICFTRIEVAYDEEVLRLLKRPR